MIAINIQQFHSLQSYEVQWPHDLLQMCHTTFKAKTYQIMKIYNWFAKSKVQLMCLFTSLLISLALFMRSVKQVSRPLLLYFQSSSKLNICWSSGKLLILLTMTCQNTVTNFHPSIFSQVIYKSCTYDIYILCVKCLLSECFSLWDVSGWISHLTASYRATPRGGKHNGPGERWTVWGWCCSRYEAYTYRRKKLALIYNLCKIV